MEDLKEIFLLYKLSQRKYESYHYLKKYVKFVSNCLKSNVTLSDDVYTENHHILPRSYFKKYSNLNVYRWNKAKLTARQHFIAHLLLAKGYGGSQWIAVRCFIYGMTKDKNDKRKLTYKDFNSRVVSKAKEEYIKIFKIRLSTYWTDERRKECSIRYTGSNNPFYGKKVSEEVKNKLSRERSGEKNYWYGKKRPEHAKLISEMFLGRKFSKEHKDNISKTHNKTYICPHCGTKGKRLLLRWHFDHCFIVDKTKNYFKAIDSNGKEYDVGYINAFAQEHKLSKPTIKRLLLERNESPYSLEYRLDHQISQKMINTIGWSFKAIRIVDPTKL